MRKEEQPKGNFQPQAVSFDSNDPFYSLSFFHPLSSSCLFFTHSSTRNMTFTSPMLTLFMATCFASMRLSCMTRLNNDETHFFMSLLHAGPLLGHSHSRPKNPDQVRSLFSRERRSFLTLSSLDYCQGKRCQSHQIREYLLQSFLALRSLMLLYFGCPSQLL